MNSNDFQVGRSADVAHASLISSLGALDHARHCAVLWFADIQKRGLYRKLGYSSMRQYATEALEFSDSRCSDFLRLAGKLEALPAIRESLSSGRLGYTKAAEIIKVATPKTVDRWVEKARTSSRRELAQTVRTVRQKAKRQRTTDPNQGSLLAAPEAQAVEIPIRLTVEMTPLQFARYEALVEQLHKHRRGPLYRAEALLAGLEEAAGISNDTTDSRPTRSGHDASRRASHPPIRIHIHRCPDCEGKTVQTHRGEQTISNQTYQQALCDAVLSEPNRPNRSAIPPMRREAVLRRARHRCETPGCPHTRFLEIHHIIPRAQGGTNAPANLRVYCSACHRLLHRRSYSGRSVEMASSP